MVFTTKKVVYLAVNKPCLVLKKAVYKSPGWSRRETTGFDVTNRSRLRLDLFATSHPVVSLLDQPGDLYTAFFKTRHGLFTAK